ncbi:unnamed protein product [Staurois parvus]|uniref:Uncharacterized protein n=1 Tax=Staurois parvus TaxID=386267 RepID=A0ABN9G9W3_9NEOB|nr:unnamed protein product [Staurois parvus]
MTPKSLKLMVLTKNRLCIALCRGGLTTHGAPGQ